MGYFNNLSYNLITDKWFSKVGEELLLVKGFWVLISYKSYEIRHEIVV